MRFSKISQAAIESGTTWVTDTLIASNFTSSVTVPRNLKAGDYVIRHEIIALHGASSDNGAQVSTSLLLSPLPPPLILLPYKSYLPPTFLLSGVFATCRNLADQKILPPNLKQAYPQCLNLRVSGSGSVAPSGGVAGTSLYKRTDPGIMFNLYTSYTSYPYPGPALWTAAN